MQLSRVFVLISVLALALLPSVSLATSVALSPTTLIAGPSTKAQALTLVNKGERSVSYQVQVLAWRQVNGNDELATTRDVMASPTVLEIPPGARRVVRVVRTSGTGQAYYQLHLRQLPEPMVPGQSGVSMRVDHHLKVAYEAPSNATPVLSAKRTPDGYLLTNTGTTAARIYAIGPAGAKPWKTGALGWVLPGGSKEFAFPQQAASLTVNVNREPTTVAVR